MDLQTDIEELEKLKECSARLKNEIDALCAETEQIKHACQSCWSEIESHRQKGCLIPPRYLEALQEATRHGENLTTPVGIFDGCPFIYQPLNTKSSTPKRKNFKNVPPANGIKTQNLRNLKSTTHTKNQKNVEQYQPTGAGTIPKTVTVFDVSQKCLEIPCAIPSKEINDWADINTIKLTETSNVSTPAKSAAVIDITVNGAYTSDQVLQNPHHHRHQSTYTPNELTQWQDVTNKTATYSGNASRDQVSNPNQQSNSCQYSAESRMYTSDRGEHNTMAPDKRVPLQGKLQSYTQSVGVDRQTSDINPSYISLAEATVLYHSPQQNNMHHCTPITSELTTQGARHCKAGLSTYTLPSAQILITPQNQQQQSQLQVVNMPRHRHLQVVNMPRQRHLQVVNMPRQRHLQVVNMPRQRHLQVVNMPRQSQLQVVNMPRQSDSTVRPSERMCVGNQDFCNISQHQNLSTFPQTPTVLTRRESVSTTAVPCGRASVDFRVLHINSQEPVLQDSTPTASLSGVSVFEPSVAGSYQRSAQNAQCTRLYTVGSDIATSSQHLPRVAQLPGLTVTQPDIATSRQHLAQKERSSQYHPRIAHLSGTAETQPYITTSKQHPAQIAQSSDLPATQPDIATSKQHPAQIAQSSDLPATQPDIATSKQHPEQKAQWFSRPLYQPHKATSRQLHAQIAQLTDLPLTSRLAVPKKASQTGLQQIYDSTAGECSHSNLFTESPSTAPQLQQTLQSTSQSAAPCQNVLAATAQYRVSLASCTPAPSPVRSQISQHIDSYTVMSQISHHTAPSTVMSQPSNLAVSSTVMRQTSHHNDSPTVIPQTSNLAAPSNVMSQTSHLANSSAANTIHTHIEYDNTTPETFRPSLFDIWLDNSSQ